MQNTETASSKREPNITYINQSYHSTLAESTITLQVDAFLNLEKCNKPLSHHAQTRVCGNGKVWWFEKIYSQSKMSENKLNSILIKLLNL